MKKIEKHIVKIVQIEITDICAVLEKLAKRRLVIHNRNIKKMEEDFRLDSHLDDMELEDKIDESDYLIDNGYSEDSQKTRLTHYAALPYRLRTIMGFDSMGCVDKMDQTVHETKPNTFNYGSYKY